MILNWLLGLLVAGTVIGVTGMVYVWIVGERAGSDDDIFGTVLAFASMAAGILLALYLFPLPRLW